jgi:hypothetical protein
MHGSIRKIPSKISRQAAFCGFNSGIKGLRKNSGGQTREDTLTLFRFHSMASKPALWNDWECWTLEKYRSEIIRLNH